MKIITSVRFNKSKAFVLDEMPKFIYYKIGNDIIYGTNGLFYQCYKYEKMSSAFKAFGGSKFSIPLNTGEIIECYGQWWDGGYDILEKELGIKLIHATYNTIENLKNCYVYTGSAVDKNKFKELIESSGDLYYHDYYDYEKILKYQEAWDKRWEEDKKLNNIIKNLRKDKEILISKIKSFAKIVKLFKDQKFINND